MPQGARRRDEDQLVQVMLGHKGFHALGQIGEERLLGPIIRVAGMGDAAGRVVLVMFLQARQPFRTIMQRPVQTRLFQQAGALPGQALEQVLTQAKSLDMAKVHAEIAAQNAEQEKAPGAAARD